MTDINGKHHSFDCKHKHMMKEGAPPYNFGILHCLLSTEFIDFNTKTDLDGYHPLVPGIISFLRWYWSFNITDDLRGEYLYNQISQVININVVSGSVNLHQHSCLPHVLTCKYLILHNNYMHYASFFKYKNKKLLAGIRGTLYKQYYYMMSKVCFSLYLPIYLPISSSICFISFSVLSIVSSTSAKTLNSNE